MYISPPSFFLLVVQYNSTNSPVWHIISHDVAENERISGADFFDKGAEEFDQMKCIHGLVVVSLQDEIRLGAMVNNVSGKRRKYLWL